MQVVIDASVAIKWYVQETLSAEALRFLDARFELIVPDLLWSEFGNILCKKVLRADLTAKAAQQIAGELRHVPLRTEPVALFLEDALDIAVRIGRTVHDSAYLALADRSACRCVTADEKLYNSVQGDRIAQRLLWIGNAP